MDENIGKLDISVHDMLLVKIQETINDLSSNIFEHVLIKNSAIYIYKILQVSSVAELLDNGDVLFSLNDFLKSYYIVVVHLFQNLNFIF